MNRLEDCGGQLAAVAAFFDELAAAMDRMPAAPARAGGAQEPVAGVGVA
jgi:hypothetical protein